MNDPRYRVITDDDKLECVEQEKFMAEIATKYAETMDEFIFQTIGPYCEVITQRSISKHDLENALTQYFKGGWISVKDRLPEHGKRYLIYATSEGGKNYRITTAAYGGHFALSGRCAYWKVTHWMPLPEPPKEET